MMWLNQVSEAVNGKMLGADVQLQGVSIDSRKECDKQLFIALNGDNFNAHDFIGQAVQQGAAAAIVEHSLAIELPQVLVSNCHQALKDLATWWRAQFAIPVIGVTGSVGKTSVKEMLGSIFSEVGKGLVTQGNLNNEIGLPLTIMRLTENDNYAILEMGMNHAGEISRLSNIAKPTIALINNAAAAHLEGLGSVAAVARAKGEIFDGLSIDGTAVINADDRHAELWQSLLGRQKVITFGLDNEADISAEYELSKSGLSMRVKGAGKKFTVALPSVGKHNVMNALAAIAVARAANIPARSIKSGLTNYRPIAGRLNQSVVGNITLIDDTYNANPASMEAAIDVLSQFDMSTLILGDMGELGSAGEREHQRLGEIASARGIQNFYACGEFSSLSIEKFDGNAQAFASQQELISFIDSVDLSGAVLVKGSRFTKMENVVEHLIRLQGPQAESNRGEVLC